MNLKKSDAFRSEAVQLALTSGLTRKEVAADLGIGFSTLNKWVAQHKHDDLMSGPHDDVHKELARLRKENRILKEEREILKRRRSSSQVKSGEIQLHSCGKDQPPNHLTLQSLQRQRKWFSCLAAAFNVATST